MTAGRTALAREEDRGRPRSTVGLLAVYLAAFLAGASGLGLEALLLAAAGPAIGQGDAAAFGLAVFLAAWALGAWLSGRSSAVPGRVLLVAGGAVLVAAIVAPRVLLYAGGLGGGFATVCALAAIAAVALPQGAFLPPLARTLGPASGVAGLFALNLVGAVGGAHLFADRLVALHGRPTSALLAGSTALVAAAVGCFGVVRMRPDRRAASGGRGEASPFRTQAIRASELDGEPTVARPLAEPAATAAGSGLDPLAAGLVLGLCTAWLTGVQWVGVRLGVLWLGGMQNALGALLAASLVALGVGASLLPPILHRDVRGVIELLALALVGSLWPFVAAEPMRALEDSPRLLRALVLVGPSLLAFGAMVPVLHRTVAGESGARLGRLLVHESWGVLLGVPLVHRLLVPAVGLGGSLATLAVLGGASFGVVAGARRRVGIGGAAVALLAALGAARLPEPALAATPFVDPALSVLAFEEDRDFAVAVVEDGLRGERTLLTDGFRAAGTGRDYRYMRVLGHLPLLLHPAPRRVAVLALGTGTTLGAVSLHEDVEEVDVLEISVAVARQAPWFEAANRGALEHDRRVRLRLGDGRHTLARERATYDVVTMEPLLPDAPFGVSLYTDGFYATARAALAPGGLLCQWVPPHALEPVTFAAVVDAFRRAFPWSSVWQFGTQVILVGAEEAPVPDTARFPSGGASSAEPGSPSEALAGALAELGLERPRGLLARYVGDGAQWPPVPRPLTDADPWILFRPRREGVELLADLPRNLASLAALPEGLPEPWRATLDEAGRRYVAGVRSIRAARLAHAIEEAARAGARLGDLVAPDYEEEMATAARLAGPDPEWAELADERRFLFELRAGVAGLRLAGEATGVRTALGHLVAAAELRPERADVHLYLAVALQRLGSAGAERALARARELCPRVLETRPGQRALELGLALPEAGP